MLRHAQFIIDQVRSCDSEEDNPDCIDDGMLSLVTLPWLKTFAELAGVPLFENTKSQHVSS